MKLSQKLASIADLPTSALKVIAEHSDWIAATVTPREGEDLLLKLDFGHIVKIETGYFLEGGFFLDNEQFQENAEYVTHYQYSKYFL